MFLTWPRRGLWRHADFLRLWGAQAVSALGSRITRTVLPLIAILTLDATPQEVAILSALQVAPGIAVGLFLGGVVDRGSKRPLLVLADLLRAALLVSVPVAAWLGALSLAHLCVVAALVGAASALFDIADNAWLPQLVGKEQLLEANSKINTTESIAEIGGPGLGGVLMQLLTAPVALLVDAASYLWSALLILRIRSVAPAAAGPADRRPPRPWRDAVIGARAAWGSPHVRPLLIMRGVGAFSGGFFLALYSLLCVQDVGLSPGFLGVIISVGGVGALIGAAFASRAGEGGRYGRVLIVTTLVTDVMALCVPAAAWAPSFGLGVLLLVVAQLVGDGFRMVSWTLEASLRQAALPGDVLGRATGTLHALLAALMPCGALIAGALAERTSVRAAMLAGILLGLFGSLSLVASAPLRRLERLSQV